MILAEYSVESNIPIIHIYDRDEKGSRIHKQIDIFEPYFYVLKDDPIKHPRIKRIEECKIKSIEGYQVKKIVTFIPKDVPEVRAQCGLTFEADILFPTRYVIDNYKEIPKRKLRVTSLDIETNYHGSFPSVDIAQQEITCLSCYDNFKDELFSFVWREDIENKIEKTTIHNVKTSILYFKTEREMLMKFLQYINDIDPDVITGWNVLDFDMRYIINRMNNLGLDFTSLSPLGIAFVKGRDVIIKGRIIFDMYRAYRIVTEGELDSYKLDAVGYTELGEKKVKYKGFLGQLWRNNIQKLIEYNTKDTLLVKRIDDKKKIIDYFDEVRRLAKCSFQDVFNNSRIIDCAILSHCKDKLILPSKQHFEDKENFGGGFVLHPKKGLHKNVIVLDLQALYPNIMRTFNMSPETVEDKKSKDNIELKITEIDYSKVFKKDISKVKSAFNDYFESAWKFTNQNFIGKELPPILKDKLKIRTVYFNQKKKGFLPEILAHIFKERLKIQKERDKHEEQTNEYKVLEIKQYAYKVLMNSFYGVLAYKGFRLFKPEIAASITYIGRQLCIWNKRKIDNVGYKTLYADTDSIFIGANSNELQKEGTKTSELLNKSYNDFIKIYKLSKHYLNIQFEKVYRTIIFGDAKKRYAGLTIWKKGKEVNKLDVAGFETKRANYSNLAQKTQRRLFEMLLVEDKSKEEIIKMLIETKKKVKKGLYSFEELAISIPLTKEISEYKSNTPSIRAILYSNRHFDLNMRPGGRCYMLYVECIPGYPKTDVFAFERIENIPKNLILDMTKTIEKQLPVKNIFNALGWSILDLKGQKSLVDF